MDAEEKEYMRILVEMSQNSAFFIRNRVAVKWAIDKISSQCDYNCYQPLPSQLDYYPQPLTSGIDVVVKNGYLSEIFIYNNNYLW